MNLRKFAVEFKLYLYIDMLSLTFHLLLLQGKCLYRSNYTLLKLWQQFAGNNKGRVISMSSNKHQHRSRTEIHISLTEESVK